jgi:hypothetical protein
VLADLTTNLFGKPLADVGAGGLPIRELGGQGPSSARRQAVVDVGTSRARWVGSHPRSVKLGDHSLAFRLSPTIEAVRLAPVGRQPGGWTDWPRTHVVGSIDPESGTTVMPIGAARKATRHEREDYEKNANV